MFISKLCKVALHYLLSGFLFILRDVGPVVGGGPTGAPPVLPGSAVGSMPIFCGRARGSTTGRPPNTRRGGWEAPAVTTGGSRAGGGAGRPAVGLAMGGVIIIGIGAAGWGGSLVGGNTWGGGETSETGDVGFVGGNDWGVGSEGQSASLLMPIEAYISLSIISKVSSDFLKGYSQKC